MDENKTNNIELSGDKERLQNTVPAANVLIVDNDQNSTGFLLKILAKKGIHGTVACDKKAVLSFLDKNKYNLAFIAVRIDQPREAFKLLNEIKTSSPEMPVIMAGETKNPNNQQHLLDVAVKAINSGCSDFLIKPLDFEKVEKLLDTFLPNHQVSSVYCSQPASGPVITIVGKSAKLLQTINLAKKIAPTSVPVLVGGESGTGKELISYIIHQHSKRANGPYIKVNCAALTESLLESELFGHEKGAFTGAHTQRKGRFEMANGGTLLLDEITETPLKFQAKLLRVLEQQDFQRVGGNDNVRVDVRIISTTNKDLIEEINNGTFRQDLYYRLSGVRLVIPSLMQRSEDLPDLVWHFVNIYSQQAQRNISKLDPSMMDIFMKFHWPGNIRQLRNVVMTSLIMGSGSTLSLADVSWLFDELQPLSQENNLQIYDSQPQISGLAGLALEQVERQAILDTLGHTGGNQTKAAKILGISDRTLRGKIRRYKEEDALQLA